MTALHHHLHPTLDSATFKKSSHSATGDCVEAALAAEGIGVRDSKNADGTTLVFSSSGWGAFIQAATSGNFTD